jgi:hypothetical protein
MSCLICLLAEKRLIAVWTTFETLPEVSALATFAKLIFAIVVNQAGCERTFSDLKVKQTQRCDSELRSLHLERERYSGSWQRFRSPFWSCLGPLSVDRHSIFCFCFCFVPPGVIPQLSWVPGLTHSCGDESAIRAIQTRRSYLTTFWTQLTAASGTCLQSSASTSYQIHLFCFYLSIICYLPLTACTSSPFANAEHINCHFWQPWTTSGKKLEKSCALASYTMLQSNCPQRLLF